MQAVHAPGNWMSLQKATSAMAATASIGIGQPRRHQEQRRCAERPRRPDAAPDRAHAAHIAG